MDARDTVAVHHHVVPMPVETPARDCSTGRAYGVVVCFDGSVVMPVVVIVSARSREKSLGIEALRVRKS